MFAPNCVGTANATTAGWGNLGGGVTQLAMPLLFALFVGTLGFSDAVSWRLSMFVVGLMCAVVGVAYYFFTQDTPEGNFRDLRAAGKLCDTIDARHVSRSLPRSPRVGPVRDLRLLLRHRDHDRKHHRSLLARLLRLLPANGPRPGAENGRPAGFVLRPDEYLRAVAGRLARRQVRQSLGTFRPREVAVRGAVLRRRGAADLLQGDDADARHPAARLVRAVRQDVQRRDVRRRAVRQSPRVGRRVRHCRRGRKRRRRARRVSCSRPKDSVGTRPCSFWAP